MESGSWIGQLSKFATTGVVGLVANLAILSALVELDVLPAVTAAVVSAALVLAGTFLLTDRWVFANATTHTGHSTLAARGMSYYGVMIAGKAVNYAIYVALLWLGVWYLAAWLVGAIVVFGLTFTANRFLWTAVFGPRSERP